MALTMLNQIGDFLFSLDMLQNLLAEVFGIILTVALIDRLLERREQQKERAKWRSTREHVGSMVGWEHTILMDKLRESTKNGYEIVFTWCEEVLEKAKEAKQQYAFAFTAEMAGSLEEYEAWIRQTGGSIASHQWRNLDTLQILNDTLLDFLNASGVSPNDIEHLYRWNESHIKQIQERLRTSDLGAADMPEPSPYIRW